MQMKESEVFDAWTILRMKVRLTEDVREDYEAHDKEVTNMIMAAYSEPFLIFIPLVHEVVDLTEANAKIWGLEASLRQEFKDDPNNTGEVSDEEYGKRAKLIREHNKMRVKAKAKIDVLYGRKPGVKVDHSSQ
jgi:hypothetical protein